jgi:hypothetical protein
MSRVEDFKHARVHRRKCVLILLFFLVITFTGIFVSDYCINSIVKDEKKVEVLQLESDQDRTIKFNIMNKEIKLNCSKVVNDFEYLKRKIWEWAGTIIK